MKKLFSLTFLAMILSFALHAQTPIKGPSTVCTGYGIMLDDSLSPGGTWSSSNTAIATVTPYTTFSAMVNGISAGVVTITYTTSSWFVTHSVTVDPSPAAITGTRLLCISGTTTMYNSVPGGVWTSGSPSIATIGSTSGIVTGVAYGVTAIMYTIGSCSVTEWDTVVKPAIYTTIGGPSSVCVGSSITLSNATSGGTWSSSSTSMATVSSGGVVTGVSAGVVTITYTISALCGPASTTKTITVTSGPSAGTISGASTVMATATTTLTSTITGGVWSSSNTAVATVNPTTGVVTGVAAGSATITYTVTGSCGTATTTAPMTVTALDIISGDVQFTGAPYYGAVKVWLIRYNPTTLILQAIDSTMVYCTTGTSVYYKFVGSPTDSFRVKAKADTMTGTFGYIPTYHNSSFYWYSATAFHHTSGTSDISKNITMLTGTITSGPGFIGGNVTTGANKGTAGDPPAIGLRMYALNASGSVIQTTKTDASGNYSFSNLPIGTYTVFPEELGYKTTAYTSIVLTAGAPSMTVASFIQHTISFTITPTSALGIPTPMTASAVSAFPNPTNGKLNIQWNEAVNETGTVTVADITGRQVYKTSIEMTQGTGVKQLDLSGLTNGMYIINVTSASVNYNNKIELAH